MPTQAAMLNSLNQQWWRMPSMMCAVELLDGFARGVCGVGCEASVRARVLWRIAKYIVRTQETMSIKIGGLLD